ncbi:ABC transporter substrate-binding protein [Paenibacillus agilis]|uniref:Extracellular solute-binding protein n=1 Tax=Paenibacillus agilis TaxID=3020863 RepID=A0A559J0D7_9BACL|nr:extracellular solute-binding protein [Paenibacillus agilis]TVX93355.1 extracellular solute-binding protein [Paenibacillus agilis]
MEGELLVTRLWKKGVLLLSIMALLSGCFGSEAVLEELDKDGKGTLKVLTYEENYFFQEYGNAFSLQFPNIDIEVVETKDLFQQHSKTDGNDETLLTKLIDEQQPDVLILAPNDYEKYAIDGKLYNLEPIIAQEQFDLEGYMVGLIDMVREKGGGMLYGLAPHFRTEVIYYNSELFERHAIELPKVGISWEELFDLAARFENTGMPGLYAGSENVEQMLYRIANAWSLQLFDAKGEKVLVESDGWKQAYQLVTDAIRTDVLQVRKWEDPANWLPANNLFLQGNAAMTIGGTDFIHQLNDPRNKKASKMDWGFVPAPINPAHPNETSSATVYDYFVINEKSSNKRAAWEFIKYVNGPEMAKASSSLYYKLPTRTGYIKSIQGKSTEALYDLQIKNQKFEYAAKQIPNEFNGEYAQLREKVLRDIIENKKTVDEALAQLQQQAQAALQNARHGSGASKK